MERLQRLLNSRLFGAPVLDITGSFDTSTRAAVIEFQQKSRLVADGIVGRKTWFQLLSSPVLKTPIRPTPRPVAVAQQSPVPSSLPPPPPVLSKPVSPAAAEIDAWSLEQRFRYVLQRTAHHLAPELRAQFEALLTPTNLAIMVGTLVVWAGGHFFGVSEVTDVVLLGVGAYFLGRAAITAASLLKNFLELTCTASTRNELEEAATDLAQAISIIGVVAFFALLAKIGRALGKARNAGSGGGAPPEEEVAPRDEPTGELKPAEEPVSAVAAPSQEAAGAQGSGAYPGVDAWKDGILKKGTVVYQGSPAGASKFFVDEKAVTSAGGDSRALAQSTQVAPHPVKGYRPGVTAYLVSEDTPMATSQALMNPQHGAGGATQFYIPNTSTLQPLYSIPVVH